MERSTKRYKLLAAIDILFLQNGINETSLSDVASLAGVPMGNIYYYFKTKKEMIRKVLKIRSLQLRDALFKIEKENLSPEMQLVKFIELFLGHPKVSLSEEMKEIYNFELQTKDFVEEPPSLGRFVTVMLLDMEKKQNKELYENFQPVIDNIIKWCTGKFTALGVEDVKTTTTNFLNMLIGACVFALNTNIKSTNDKDVSQYINFVMSIVCSK